MSEAGKGDFLVVETSVGRPELDDRYRGIAVVGRTLSRGGLLSMATGIRRARDGSAAPEVADVAEAVSVVRGGGWAVLEFLS